MSRRFWTVKRRQSGPRVEITLHIGELRSDGQAAICRIRVVFVSFRARSAPRATAALSAIIPRSRPLSSSSTPQTAPAFQPPRTIAIEGPIRVGKSTLSRILADRLHARRVFRSEDNPFLADFYKEKPGSAFRAQMYFLFERHRRLPEVLQGDVGVPLVSDFLFEKDKILRVHQPGQ